MIPTARKFCQLGEALYGERWKAVLARAMTVNHRVVKFYSTGDRSIPWELWKQLSVICRARGEALIRIADEIDASA